MDRTEEPKSSILIAHLGDIHLRDTQYGTAKRGADFFNAAYNAITAVCSATPRPDVVVIAGDIFDSSRPSPRVIGQIMALDAALRRNGMPALSVTGNHDFTNPTWLATLFPDASPDGGIFPLDGQSLDIQGFRFTGVPPLTTGQFLSDVNQVAMDTLDADVWIYHNFVTGIVPCFVGEKTHIDVKDLPVSRQNKAVLLGDIHAQGYVTKDGALIGYPGSTELCSSNESIDKSIPMIRVDREKAVVESHVAFKSRRVIVRTVETVEDLDQLVADVTAVKDEHPLVHVDYNRDVTDTFTRLYAILDLDQAILRCYPLPVKPIGYERLKAEAETESLPFSHFLSAMFEDSELESVVMSLYHRPEDASNILTDLIEARQLDPEL